MTEIDFEAWKEIRSRVDSIANALFLIAGGALSISIAILLNKDAPKLPAMAKCLMSLSWYCLLYSVVAFVLIKGILVVQAYKHYSNGSHNVTWHQLTTRVNWFLGLTGLPAFILGMFVLVKVAIDVIS